MGNCSIDVEFLFCRIKSSADQLYVTVLNTTELCFNPNFLKYNFRKIIMYVDMYYYVNPNTTPNCYQEPLLESWEVYLPYMFLCKFNVSSAYVLFSQCFKNFSDGIWIHFWSPDSHCNTFSGRAMS
jgi:hypothetical protein